MSNDKGATGSDAGWENVQSIEEFNQDKVWSGASDDQVTQNIKTRKEREVKEKEFIKSGKVKTPFLLFKPLEGLLKKGSIKTRTFFTNSVLSKKGVTYNGTKYSKTEFQNLSVDKQNEIYGGYMEDRLSGKTDAYGNPIGGYRRETIKHKNKDGTYTTKSVWQGGNDNDPPKRMTEKQIETESEKETEKETEKDTRTEEEKEEDYKKVKGLKGSRSLFGNAGGRGYFDPV